MIEGVERIEVAVRTQVGHVLGEHAPFAHEDGSLFTEAFTAHRADASDGSSPHTAWLQRVRERQDSSDESFVAHFRTKYDDRMPIWALTEILELDTSLGCTAVSGTTSPPGSPESSASRPRRRC